MRRYLRRSRRCDCDGKAAGRRVPGGIARRTGDGGDAEREGAAAGRGTGDRNRPRHGIAGGSGVGDN